MGQEANQWRDWLGQHGPAPVLLARQWSATSADAEDATQDGFVKFWKSRQEARDPLAYLYACVRTAAMDLGRSRRRRARRERWAGQPEEAPRFEPPSERGEREAMIGEALGQLPGDQREVVVMKIWGGLTFGQIGEALGIPLSTAASRYRYAMARLEADLREEATRERGI